MTSTEALNRLDAVGAARLIDTGEVTPLELVDAAIRRIEAANPSVNAVITERFDRAREEARQVGAGRFQGVPIVAKDYRFEVQGEPTSYGLAALQSEPVAFPTTTYLARQLTAAGFIVVGRANTPELAMSVTTEPIAHGPTRNPWALERSSGGSSGGSAAAVASCMVPVGIGTDGGGSLRIPAAACGVVGLKPSRGRVSLGPGAAEYWAGASIDGAITRTVRDAAAVLDCVRRAYPGDPYAAPAPASPFEEEVGRAPGRLRIGVLEETADLRFAPSAQGALARTVALLERHGHDVVPATPPDYLAFDLGQHFGTVVAPEVAALLARLEGLRGRPILDDELEPRNVLSRERGRATTATEYVEARSWLGAWARRAAAFWTPTATGGQGFDLLLTPTLNDLPPLIGVTTADPIGGDAELSGRMAPFTSQVNILGFPAISLPLDVTPTGLPVGMQFVAGAGEEAVLLRLAAQLEDDFRPAYDHLPM